MNPILLSLQAMFSSRKTWGAIFASLILTTSLIFALHSGLNPAAKETAVQAWFYGIAAVWGIKIAGVAWEDAAAKTSAAPRSLYIGEIKQPADEATKMVEGISGKLPLPSIALVLGLGLGLVFLSQGCKSSTGQSKYQAALEPKVRLVQIEASYDAAIQALTIAAQNHQISPAQGHDIRIAVQAFDAAFASAEAAVVQNPPPSNLSILMQAVESALVKVADLRLRVAPVTPTTIPTSTIPVMKGNSDAYVNRSSPRFGPSRRIGYRRPTGRRCPRPSRIRRRLATIGYHVVLHSPIASTT